MTMTPTSATRLLMLADDPTTEVSLARHLNAFGPLPLPGSKDRGYQAHLRFELERAGLIGKGGGGFPAFRKLDLALTQRHVEIVVNAMEGEPASKKDATLARYAPHLVLDGALALARATGARTVTVCVARDQVESARYFETAIDERTERVTMRVVTPPPHYVAGEESALIHWLNGGECTPTFRPEKPTVLKIGRRPALVHNAESMAHVGLIARFGGAWYASRGSTGNPMTLVTLSGAVTRPGVYEIEVGQTLDSLIRAAGGCPDGFGGALIGGYSGAWLAPEELSTALSKDGLAHVRGSLGAGAIIVLPAQRCPLAEVAAIASWMASESAGQCGPCAFGLPAIAADLALIRDGRALRADLARLEGRMSMVHGRGACAHPDGVVRMVASGLRSFSSHVEHHLTMGKCRGVDTPGVAALPWSEEPAPWR